MSKTFKKHLAELDRGQYGHGFIIGLRKALHKVDRERYGLSIGQTAPAMTAEQVDKVLARIRHEKPRVDAVQTAKGLAFLEAAAEKRYRRRFTARHREILGAFSHFELIDFDDVSENRFAHFTPVYRVVSTDGGFFDYYNVAWQSGGDGPVIVG